MGRRKAREKALKVLFQVDLVNADPKKALTYVLSEENSNETDKDFAQRLIAGVLENCNEINKIIKLHRNFLFSTFHIWNKEVARRIFTPYGKIPKI